MSHLHSPRATPLTYLHSANNKVKPPWTSTQLQLLLEHPRAMFPRQLEANGRQCSHPGEDSRARWLTTTAPQCKSAILNYNKISYIPTPQPSIKSLQLIPQPIYNISLQISLSSQPYISLLEYQDYHYSQLISTTEYYWPHGPTNILSQPQLLTLSSSSLPTLIIGPMAY